MPVAPRSLQEELQQSRPFSSPAEEALVALMRTAALVRRAIAQRVEPYGISPAQYNVLRILRGAGPDGLPTLAVRDRRMVQCCITERGLALLVAMDTLVRETTELVSAGIPDEADQRLMIDLLAKVRAGMAE